MVLEAQIFHPGGIFKLPVSVRHVVDVTARQVNFVSKSLDRLFPVLGCQRCPDRRPRPLATFNRLVDVLPGINMVLEALAVRHWETIFLGRESLNFLLGKPDLQDILGSGSDRGICTQILILPSLVCSEPRLSTPSLDGRTVRALAWRPFRFQVSRISIP